MVASPRSRAGKVLTAEEIKLQHEQVCLLTFPPSFARSLAPAFPLSRSPARSLCQRYGVQEAWGPAVMCGAWGVGSSSHGGYRPPTPQLPTIAHPWSSLRCLLQTACTTPRFIESCVLACFTSNGNSTVPRWGGDNVIIKDMDTAFISGLGGAVDGAQGTGEDPEPGALCVCVSLCGCPCIQMAGNNMSAWSFCKRSRGGGGKPFAERTHPIHHMLNVR